MRYVAYDSQERLIMSDYGQNVLDLPPRAGQRLMMPRCLVSITVSVKLLMDT